MWPRPRTWTGSGTWPGRDGVPDLAPNLERAPELAQPWPRTWTGPWPQPRPGQGLLAVTEDCLLLFVSAFKLSANEDCLLLVFFENIHSWPGLCKRRHCGLYKLFPSCKNPIIGPGPKMHHAVYREPIRLGPSSSAEPRLLGPK